MFNALLDGGAGAVSQYNRCIGVWPEAEACALKGLVGLAQCCDRSLRRYLTGHDAFMCRGPYNYARVRALTKHSRAREFCAAVARLGPPAENAEAEMADLRSQMREPFYTDCQQGLSRRHAETPLQTPRAGPPVER